MSRLVALRYVARVLMLVDDVIDKFGTLPEGAWTFIERLIKRKRL